MCAGRAIRFSVFLIANWALVLEKWQQLEVFVGGDLNSNYICTQRAYINQCCCESREEVRSVNTNIKGNAVHT